MDMEWNQPWPGSYAAQRPLPIHISGEVIQIGAVRMLEDQTIADEFQVLVAYWRKDGMHDDDTTLAIVMNDYRWMECRFNRQAEWVW